MRQRAANLYNQLSWYKKFQKPNIDKIESAMIEVAAQARLDTIVECADIISKTRHRDTACKKLLALATPQKSEEGK